MSDPYLLHLVPNPAIPNLDFEKLAQYTQDIASGYQFNILVRTFFLAVPARKKISVFFSASRCHPEGERAAGVTTNRGLQLQNGYQSYPIYVICDRIAASARDVDTLHQLHTRVIIHELLHNVAGLPHSNDRRDVMFEGLVPGIWYIRTHDAMTVRHFLR